MSCPETRKPGERGYLPASLTPPVAGEVPQSSDSCLALRPCHPTPLPDALLLISHVPPCACCEPAAHGSCPVRQDVTAAYESIWSLAHLCSLNRNVAGSKIYLILI